MKKHEETWDLREQALQLTGFESELKFGISDQFFFRPKRKQHQLRSVCFDPPCEVRQCSLRVLVRGSDDGNLSVLGKTGGMYSVCPNSVQSLDLLEPKRAIAIFVANTAQKDAKSVINFGCANS